MDTKSFLEKVLPNKGNYVLHLHRGKNKWNENFLTIDELCHGVEQHDETETTVFFAVGAFEDNVGVNPRTNRSTVFRTQDKAVRFKTLCCDIDVGFDAKKNAMRKYETGKDAVRELFQICDKLSLAKPMIVSSGRGVHCYWPLTEEISAKDWEGLSIRLRAALQQNGLDLDASKIHDKSMVLRPVGSHHKKDPENWKPVRLLADAEPISASEYMDVLADYEIAMPGKKKKKPMSAVMAAVLEGGSPINIQSIAARCHQVKSLVESGGVTDASGATVEEPLWRASLGLAKYADDQEAAILSLCGKYPGFDLDANMDKLSKWGGTGPTLCSTFDQLCPTGCEKCEHKGKISSPAQLTTGIVEVEMTNPETQEVVQIKLPPRYSIKNGAVYRTPAGSDEDVFVSPYMIYVVGCYESGGQDKQTAKLLVRYPLEGDRVVDVDSLAIATGGSELAKALTLRQIYIPGDLTEIKRYLMNYLMELQKSMLIEKYYQHFGWQLDNSFLGNDGIIGKDVGGLVHYDGPIQDYQTAITQRGSIQGWVKLTKLFAQPDAKYHGLVFLMMAGSILMKGSGLASVLVNSYSKESGSGKTITARMGLSIWGQPSKMMRTVNDTDNALYKHFGIMHSIGAYIDEITTMDPERLRAFAFTLQEGRERDRVRQSADGFREKVSWCMPLFASSNRDAYDVIGMRYSSEAEKLRILQFTFDKLEIFDRPGANVGYTMSKFLEENHGFVGPMLVQEVLARGGPSEVFDKAYHRFQQKYNFTFTGPERFYQAMMVIADAMGEIMTDMGLILFDYETAVRRGLDHIRYLRDSNIENAMSGLDICMQYLTEHADKIVHYREVQAKQGPPRKFVLEPAPKGAVARTEVVYDTKDSFVGGFLYINRPMFKKWCLTNGVEFKAVLTSLARDGIRAEDNVRKTLFKGVQGSTSAGQTYTLMVDMSTHPRFVEANSNEDAMTALNVTPRLAAIE